jgi:hypothetical protein
MKIKAKWLEKNGKGRSFLVDLIHKEMHSVMSSSHAG